MTRVREITPPEPGPDHKVIRLDTIPKELPEESPEKNNRRAERSQ